MRSSLPAGSFIDSPTTDPVYWNEVSPRSLDEYRRRRGDRLYDCARP